VVSGPGGNTVKDCFRSPIASKTSNCLKCEPDGPRRGPHALVEWPMAIDRLCGYVRQSALDYAVYMDLIDPFRKWIIYPALLRSFVNWDQNIGRATRALLRSPFGAK